MLFHLEILEMSAGHVEENILKNKLENEVFFLCCFKVLTLLTMKSPIYWDVMP
jgi:hypothetical protein